MNKLALLINNIKRKFKQMTCDHNNAISLGQKSGVHFAFCKDCDKHLHFTRKDS